MKKFSILFTLFAFLATQNTMAQDSIKYPDTTFVWYHSDPASTEYVGISLKQADELAKKNNLSPKEIVVAVIDSGIDTSHVDLEANLWTNPGEIPFNGIDDDNNGYIDDVHGWNFPGHPDGYCVEGETLELTRLYSLYKKKFKGKTIKDLPAEDKEDFKEWQKIKKEFEAERKIARSSYDNLKMGLEYYDDCVKRLAELLNNPNFTREDVEAIETDNRRLKAAKEFYLEPFGIEMDREEFVETLEYYDSKANQRLNVLYDPRAKVGDKRYDINDSLFGNNILYPEGSNHGTGVSGIIGAVRGNGIGLDGIAPKVKIMTIRVVPGGDEYDKDVALAIKYAVKMGARIINCSFGKDWSPQKEYVDEAVRFAAKNDVLIIHAAGNDSKNIDKGANFPTKYMESPEETAWNWIEVGASGPHADLELVADFSNYGQEIDIFAPGVDIFSTAVKSKFSKSSGTSDAAPVVTGVATFVLSYFPDLTAAQLRAIIIDSGLDYGKTKVYRPTEGKKKKKTRFKKLSSTGKIVNAEAALRLAIERHS
jgi:subtilisin family serine protease